MQTHDPKRKYGAPEGVEELFADELIEEAPAISAAPMPLPYTTPVLLLLGEILLRERGLSAAKLEESLSQQMQKGGLIGELLVEKKACTEADVAFALSKQAGVIFYETLKVTEVDGSLSDTIPIQYAKNLLVLPIRRQGDGVVVALTDPMSCVATDDLRSFFECEIYPAAMPREELLKLINAIYDQKAGSLAGDHLDDEKTEAIGMDRVEELGDLIDATDEAPIIRFINSIISEAVKDKASDIHIEPMEKDVLVRFRQDGELREKHKAPKKFQSAIASRVKLMGGLDIAEKRLPQDGRIPVKIAGKNIDIRLSSIPVAHGEKLVLRILDKSSVLLDLSSIGFTDKKRRDMEAIITRPHGIFLVTGPTGSGKTTTLYSALAKINAPNLNIVTVEDPVEYQLPGINQTAANPKIDYTFANALRAFLRQDPDVILVGEIRDKETAETSVQASLTGHLVFSTIHTNDAATAITRLIEMGIEPFLVASSLVGLLAQRLVRRVCKKCRIPYVPKPDELVRLGLDPNWVLKGEGVAPAITLEVEPPLMPGRIMIYRASQEGCAECGYLGYKGRTGIYELLMINDEIRSLTLKRVDAGSIKRAAQAAGMTSLRDDGALKVLQGHTTIEEVLLITQDDM
jgi:general secretion pathway protein E